MKFNDDQKNIIASLAAQGIVTIAEYRGEKTEVFSYIDKESGFKRHMGKHHLALEYIGSGEQVPSELYTERTPEPPKDAKGKVIGDQPEPPPPVKTNLEKGEPVIVLIGSYVAKGGQLSVKVRSITRLNDPGKAVFDVAPEADKPAATEYAMKPRPASKA